MIEAWGQKHEKGEQRQRERREKNKTSPQADWEKSDILFRNRWKCGIFRWWPGISLKLVRWVFEVFRLYGIFSGCSQKLFLINGRHSIHFLFSFNLWWANKHLPWKVLGLHSSIVNACRLNKTKQNIDLEC